MGTSSNKMDSAEVYNMFETLKEQIIKQAEKPAEKSTEPVKLRLNINGINMLEWFG